MCEFLRTWNFFLKPSWSLQIIDTEFFELQFHILVRSLKLSWKGALMRPKRIHCKWMTAKKNHFWLTFGIHKSWKIILRCINSTSAKSRSGPWLQCNIRDINFYVRYIYAFSCLLNEQADNWRQLMPFKCFLTI